MCGLVTCTKKAVEWGASSASRHAGVCALTVWLTGSQYGWQLIEQQHDSFC